MLEIFSIRASSLYRLRKKERRTETNPPQRILFCVPDVIPIRALPCFSFVIFSAVDKKQSTQHDTFAVKQSIDARERKATMCACWASVLPQDAWCRWKEILEAKSVECVRQTPGRVALSTFFISSILALFSVSRSRDTRMPSLIQWELDTRSGNSGTLSRALKSSSNLIKPHLIAVNTSTRLMIVP